MFLFIFIVCSAFLLRVYVLQPATVEGHSMDTSLTSGDFVLSNKMGEISRFDIITTHEPDEPDTLIVKRVIGLPGDVINMQGDVLTINGTIYDEPYLSDLKSAFENGTLRYRTGYEDLAHQQLIANSTFFTSDFTVEVPDGYYYVLGDNRLISKDSRMFGPVKADYIIGKVIFNF